VKSAATGAACAMGAQRTAAVSAAANGYLVIGFPYKSCASPPPERRKMGLL
jgi:hypothetical protein